MRDYGGLDLYSPIQHAALAIEASQSVSIEELAATYRHPVPADIERVKQVDGLPSNAEAIKHLLRFAIEKLE